MKSIPHYNKEPLSDADMLVGYLRSILLNDVVGHKNSVVAGRLEWCRTQAARRPEACDGDIAEQKYNRIALALTANKVNDLYSWLLDLVVKGFDDLFRISPTPRPDLSNAARAKTAEAVVTTITEIIKQRGESAAQLVMAQYAQLGVSVAPDQAVQLAEEQGAKVRLDEAELRDIVLEMKGTALRLEQEAAAKGAKRLTSQVKDYLVQSRAFDQIKRLLHDFSVYPYCCIAYGETLPVKTRTWDKKDKLVWKDAYVPTLRRVSPFDLFWDATATDAQDAQCLAERYAMRRGDILKLKGIKGSFVWDPEAIDALINDFETTGRDWLVTNRETVEDVIPWSASPGETLDVFRVMLRTSGYWIRKYHKELPRKVNPEEQYMLDAFLAGNRILGVTIRDYDWVRPYSIARYEPLDGEFAGVALPEVLAVLSAASRRTFLNMIQNAAKSSNPAQLINRDMLTFDDLDEGEAILPDTVYDFVGSLGASARPVELLNMPDMSASLMNLQTFLEAQADLATGIPRYAMGQANNMPSALRSVGMLTAMLDSALKVVKARVTELGESALVPAIRGIVKWVYDNHPDESLKVDAEVAVTGLDGILTKALVTDRLQSLMQYLSPFVQQGMIGQDVVTSLLRSYLLESGVDMSDYGSVLDTAKAEMSQPPNSFANPSSGAQMPPPGTML